MSLRVEAAPDRLWPLITDITLPVGAAGELEDAHWTGGASPQVGAVFVGTNRNEHFGQWQTTSTVTACDEPRIFAWAVGDVGVPNTSWSFELVPDGAATVVTQTARLGIGESGRTYAIRDHPDKEERIVERRLDDFRSAMRANLERLRALAESR